MKKLTQLQTIGRLRFKKWRWSKACSNYRRLW